MAVGCWSPDFLRQVLTAEQWLGWVRFNEVEPLGEWRNDARTLSLWQAILAGFGGMKLDEVTLPTMPYAKGQPRMTDEEALAKLRKRRAEIAAAKARLAADAAEHPPGDVP